MRHGVSPDSFFKPHDPLPDPESFSSSFLSFCETISTSVSSSLPRCLDAPGPLGFRQSIPESHDSFQSTDSYSLDYDSSFLKGHSSWEDFCSKEDLLKSRYYRRLVYISSVFPQP